MLQEALCCKIVPSTMRCTLYPREEELYRVACLLFLITCRKIARPLHRNVIKNRPIVDEDETWLFSHVLDSLGCVLNEWLIRLHPFPNLFVWFILRSPEWSLCTCGCNYAHLMRGLHDVLQAFDWLCSVFDGEKCRQVGSVGRDPNKNAEPVTSSKNTTCRETRERSF